MYALLSRCVDQPRNIGWCGGNVGVDVLQIQDGGIAPVEGVGICAVKIVPIDGRW